MSTSHPSSSRPSFSASMANSGGRNLILNSQAVHAYKLLKAKSTIDTSAPRSYLQKQRRDSLKSTYGAGGSSSISNSNTSRRRLTNPDPSNLFEYQGKKSLRPKSASTTSRSRARRSKSRSKKSQKKARKRSRVPSAPHNSAPHFAGQELPNYAGMDTMPHYHPAADAHMLMNHNIPYPHSQNTPRTVANTTAIKNISDELDSLIQENRAHQEGLLSVRLNPKQQSIFDSFASLLTDFSREDSETLLQELWRVSNEQRLLSRFGGDELEDEESIRTGPGLVPPPAYQEEVYGEEDQYAEDERDQAGVP